MRYLATGAEDGHVYVYDTRHVTSFLHKLDTCGPEAGEYLSRNGNKATKKLDKIVRSKFFLMESNINSQVFFPPKYSSLTRLSLT